MMAYAWVAVGSALGGMARYAITRWMLPFSLALPWGTILINILGSFVIGFVGTYTLAGSRHALPENGRIFLMVGVCGGFTTFSAFSLQTFDLVRAGSWGRALLNALLSITLCFCAVGLGHLLAQRTVPRAAIAQAEIEDGMEI